MDTFTRVGLTLVAIGCSLTIILLPVGAIIFGQIAIINELEKINAK